MTEQLFIRILNMSLTGSFVILAVLAIRVLLRKMPSIFSYCLWAVVLFRLLCPVSFTAAFSPLNALPAPLAEHALTENGRIEYIPENIFQDNRSAAPFAMAETNHSTYDTDQNSNAAAKTGARSNTEFAMKTAAGVWLVGTLIMSLCSITALPRLKRKLESAIWKKENIYIIETISTPFVIGLIRPRIYLPSILGEEEMKYILLHEQIHLRRGDHIVKIVSFVTLCLHWFNPLVWAAFFLSGKDMEMSCDEAVIRKIGSSVKKKYSTSLLCLSTGKRIVNGVPLAFGEGDTGSRIKNVLHYQRPAAFALGIAAAVCIAAAVILLANPEKPESVEEKDTSLTYYGIVTDVVSGDTSYRLLLCPGIGELEIPAAEAIDTYFEPGDERNPHELLPGDLAAVTFTSEEAAAIRDAAWPAQFSGSAESIAIMWQGLSLKEIGSNPNLSGKTYLLTFPGGVVPDGSTAKPGDTLSFYWETDVSASNLPQDPESESSRLIASAPILTVTENEYGGVMLTTELSASETRQLLAGFGFHIRFALEPGETLTEVELRTNNEMLKVYLQNPEVQSMPTEQEKSADTPYSSNTITINLRSLERSSRTIHSYGSFDGDLPDDSLHPLTFAEDCVFQANYSMDGIDYKEISYDTFADIIMDRDIYGYYLNDPCTLTFQDGLITEADLLSAWAHYGISFDMFTPTDSIYEYLQQKEGENAFDTYYSLASTENMDISDCEGIEIIEVYTGNAGDGDSGIVMFKNAEGELLCRQEAHVARAGWNNIYLGEKDGIPFIMNVYVEDRWDFGGYGYWVYRLDEKGGIRQIAGSRFDFQLGTLAYDDELFREWTGNMTAWLENSHLILSSQEGEIRTEKATDTDRYNYETLNLKDRPSPF